MIATKTFAKSDSGFTLLELLIVITILGLILMALTSGVRFAGQAWEVQERRSNRQGDLDAVQNVLRELMASATHFQGDAASLRFVSVLPLALARGGLYDVEIRASAHRLLFAWKPHFKGPSLRIPPTEIELIKNVTGFELTYYVPPGGWQHVLTAEMRPPALIKVNLQLGEGRVWPPLVVAPMIELRQLPETETRLE
jgi:general secretion pathway protein J